MRLGGDIAERLLELAAGALAVSAELPTHPSGRHVALQLARAGTAGGANYEEARAAESRSDFIHKVGIASKEVRETGYWLTVVKRANWKASNLERAPGPDPTTRSDPLRLCPNSPNQCPQGVRLTP